MPLYIGIDLGTSGCRAVAIDADLRQIAEHRVTLPPPERSAPGHSEQDPEIWWQGVRDVLRGLAQKIDARSVEALAVDGTSGTLLLADASGTPLTTGLMYDDSRARKQAARIADIAPADSTVGSPTSGLAKLLYLADELSPRRDFMALHQADWILGRLMGRYGVSDINNALKLGYDAAADDWPQWLDNLDVDRGWLPEVVMPGVPLGQLSPLVAEALGLTSDVSVIAGTTDSTASVIAAGARVPGDAVSVLGSTLVVKVVSERPVSAPEYGVYSHRFGDHWLTGGASNSGGAVLRQYFTPRELDQLEARLRPEHPTGLDYYPLLRPGERFPVNDPGLEPRIEPRPASRTQFLQGLMEGIAAIEARGYRRLAELGCPYPGRVLSTGGGAVNEAWRRIRERHLGVPVLTASHQEAAYGTALIAAGRYMSARANPSLQHPA